MPATDKDAGDSRGDDRACGAEIASPSLGSADRGEAGALLDQWLQAHQPASEVERYLVESIVHHLIRIRRCRRVLDELEEDLRLGAESQWLIEQHEEVARLTELLDREPDRAVAALEQTAGGCLWLINGWTELERLVNLEESAAAGGRSNLPRANGTGLDTGLEPLETYRLTRVFRLLAPDAPRPDAVAAFHASRVGSVGLSSETGNPSLPRRSECRRRVRAVIARELPPLRLRHERLRVEHEEPARAAAIRAAIFESSSRRKVLRMKQKYERLFQENYQLLREAREESLPPCAQPGLPGAAATPHMRLRMVREAPVSRPAP